MKKSAEHKKIFIDAGEIYLRLPEEKDLKGNWYKWLNDPIVTRYQNKGIFPNTPARQKKYYICTLNSRSDIVFAIIEKKTKRHIGSVGLHNIDPIHRSAEVGIVIGEKDSWGKGYGKIAWNLISNYGLNVLNLHRLYANIFEENEPSLRAAIASGFSQEGKLRDAYFKNGKYYSSLLLSVLKDEFKKIY